MAPLVLLGVPSAAAAYGPGQDLTPERLRAAGLLDALEKAHPGTQDLGDTVRHQFSDDPEHPEAQNAEDVLSACRAVVERLEAPLAGGARALVIGGDCTVELGVVAAAVAGDARVGLLYIDYDADLNVPSSGQGRFDWMGVAHLLDIEGADRRLAGLGSRTPMLPDAAVWLLGAENFSDFEREQVRSRALRVDGVERIRDDLSGLVDEVEVWARDFDLVLIHVDVDVLDFEDFPIAENTRRCPGLTFDELSALLLGLVSLPQARTLTLSEINLDHAPDPRAAATAVISLLGRCADAWAASGTASEA